MGEQPELYAYRCGADLSAAIVDRYGEQERFRTEVWLAWNREHRARKVRAAFDRQVGIDITLVGFLQDDKRAKIPGLSMSLRRGYALPVKGKAGDYWRAQMATLRPWPSMQDVFDQAQIPTVVMSGNLLCSVGYEMAIDGVVYLACEASLFQPVDAIPPGLTRIPLSEFHAAREAREAATQGGGR